MADAIAVAALPEVVRAAARAYERDRYLAALLAPGAHRADLVALAAFAGEVARIPGFVSEPMLGEIRLQWWHDTLARLSGAGAIPSGHPIADAMAAAMRRNALPWALVEGVIDAQVERLPDVPFADTAALLTNVDRSEGGLFELGWRIVSGPEPAGRTRDAMAHAARCYGIARLLVELPASLAQGRVLLPRDRAGTIADVHEPANRMRLDEAIASLAIEAELAIASLRAEWAALPAPARRALLPVALVKPYLRLSRTQHFGAGLSRDVAPLSRVWRLWSVNAGLLP